MNSSLQPKKKRLSNRLRYWIPALLVIPLAVLAAPWLIGDPCPKQVTILTGDKEGAYFAFAQEYRQLLAEEGIELKIVTTNGSVDNGHRLGDDDIDASSTVAIMQGGCCVVEAEHDQLRTLASLYVEPVWIFSRERSKIMSVGDLKKRRVAVGPPGSGTRTIATQLLGECGLCNAVFSQGAQGEDHQHAGHQHAGHGHGHSGNSNEKHQHEHFCHLLPLKGREAVDALKKGDVDALFLVISPTSPLIRELLATPGIRLMNIRRVAAFQKKYPFLTSRTLTEGVVDLEKNLPSHDFTLLAPTANLVARKELHPALVPLLLKAAIAVHESGGVLEHTGEYPSAHNVDFHMDAHAKSYLKSGPSFLYRYLPFHVAAWIDRTKLMLLPLCTLLIPLFKVAPPIYRWRTRSKIYRLYEVLRDIDEFLGERHNAETIFQAIQRLEALETEAAAVTVPLSYMQEFYNLRIHAAFLLIQLHKRMQEATHSEQGGDFSGEISANNAA